MRSNRIFWGLVILALGVILLLSNLGVLTANIWSIIWPFFLVLLGIWFLLGPVLARGSRDTRQLSLPLEGANSAEVTIKHGAGRLEIHSLADDSLFMDGSFGGGVNASNRLDGSTRKLELSVPTEVFGPWFPFMGHWEGLQWNVGFNRNIPLRMRFETGAGESVIDLTDLQVNDLHFESGASSTRLLMPAHAGVTRAEIKTGAASLEMRIPEGVGASLRITSGLAGINVDSRRFVRQGDVYQTENYASAENRMDIRIETGVGSVDVR